MTRRIVGNLDFEQDLAMAGAMSAAAAARIAPLATLLRVFAEEGDRLWTPSPVDVTLVPPVGGLPVPALESGPLEKLCAVDETLAWGQSEACARLTCGARATVSGSSPLHRHVWELPRAKAEVAKAMNDRRFFLRVAREFGTLLPGADYFDDREVLLAHLATQTAKRFVLKAPFSAAGRSRLLFDREAASRSPTCDRIDALFARYGGALLEPWMDRTDDFGALGLVSDRGVALLGLHRQHVTVEGQFAGITLRPFSVPSGVSKEEVASLTVAARRVGEELLGAGYRGPYSVDSWRFRTASGQLRLQPIGEINARITMGLVARVAAERVFGPCCVDEVVLRLDDEATPEGDDVVVLLGRPRVTLVRVPVE